MAFYDDDPYAMFSAGMGPRGVYPPSRRFDEYYRCYPIVMMPGPERPAANHGGKVFLPASALDKLTRLHISYPMLFELINGRVSDKVTHASVLEFTAEEGKIYMPHWLMRTLSLEPGDLVQIKSTDLPAGQFIKLQPQSPAFLDISDPKAVLENAFRNFACLTIGDVFSFEYNDAVYEIEVLEVKPDTSKHAIYTMETDLSVDFAPPVGYVEPEKQSAAQSGLATTKGKGGKLGGFAQQGTMAARINYDAIKPQGSTPAVGAAATASNFVGVGGHRLGSTRSSAKTSGTSTPAVGSTSAANSTPAAVPAEDTKPVTRRTNGPQPLRLPPGQLFFGWDVVPLKKDKEKAEKQEKAKMKFQGMGQTLRGKKVEAPGPEDESDDVKMDDAKGADDGKGKGRTLRDTPRA